MSSLMRVMSVCQNFWCVVYIFDINYKNADK